MATINLEGFGQVEIRDDFLDLSPEQQAAEIQRIKGGTQVQTQPEEAPDEDVSVFLDVAEGVGAGVVGLAQGISETVAAGYDYATDSNTSRNVTQSFQGVKQTLGLTPETTAGEIASLITNFGLGAFVPLSWVSRAKAAATGTSALNATSALGRSAQAFGSSKAGGAIMRSFPGRVAVTSLGVGAADFFVSPDGLNTAADAFDALPDELETEDDTGLTGRDEAARRFRNKLRFAAEGAALSGAFDIAIPVVGKTVGTAAQVPGVSVLARGVSTGFEKMGEQLSRLPFADKFKSTGKLPRDFFELLQDARGGIDEQANTVVRLLEDIDTTAKELAGKQFPFMKNKEGRQAAYNALESFLEGNKDAFKGYGDKAKPMIESATRLRNQIDDLSDRVFNEVDGLVARGQLDEAKGLQIKAQIESNRGKYLRRLYAGPQKVTDAAAFRSTPDYAKAVDEVYTFMQRQKPDVDEGIIRGEAVDFVDGQLGFKPGLEGLDPEMVLKESAKNLKAINAGAKPDIPLYDVSDSILQSRNQILEKAPTLRGLKGEKRGSEQAIKERAVRTVTDLATFSNMSKFYANIANDSKLSVAYDDIVGSLNSGARPLVLRAPQGVDELGAPVAGSFPKNEEASLNALGYVKLPEGAASITDGPFGALSGSMVRKEVKDILTYDRLAEGTINSLWAVALQAKGISQVAQTVLNPVGQIRNAYGNELMLLANGNVAGFSSIADSISLAMGKAARLNDKEFKEFYNWMGDLGLRDQNVQVNEYRLLMREGKGPTNSVEDAVRQATEAGMERFIPGFKSLSKTYSGMDNAGKTASVMMERAKYVNAFRRAGVNLNNLDAMADDFVAAGLAVRKKALNEDIPFDFVMAADITKSTMPIYSRVPEFIRGLRKLPLGNFIAFPAEVIRNSTNILHRSMKEMGVRPDDFIKGIKAANPSMTDDAARAAANRLAKEIKAIGSKRLTGLSMVAGVVPYSLQAAAMRLNNVSEEQMDAINQFAAPFQRGHILLPVNVTEDKIEHIDLSYMMPYDYLIAPIRNAQRTFAEKGEIDASTAETIISSAAAGVLDLIEPFASEAIVAERFLDVTARGGKTKLGSYIYRDGDDEGEKLVRRLTHVLGGFNPAMMKYIVDVKKGEPVAGRLVRAITNEPGAQGQEFTVQEELLSLLTGFRKQEIDLNTALDYKGYEYSGPANSIKSGFRNKARAADTSVGELQAEFTDLQTDLQRLQADLYRNIKAAEALGMSRTKIRKNLKDANIGSKEMRDIMRGRFSPYKASSQLSQDIRKKAREQDNRLLDRLPTSELREVERGFRGRELFPQQEINPAPQLPSAPAPATMAPAAGPQSSTSPTLLGDNPIEQARNLELANRLRGKK